MSKITCFNNTKLEEVFNSNKVTEQFEENAAVNIIKAEYDTILAELNAIKEELGIPTEESKIITSKIKFQKEESKIMFQIVGEKGASNIEQYQQSLNQAKKLDEEGVSINEIEKQTGWFKNEQGQWKYFSNEILNEFLDISQRRNETVDLKEILKKDSLLLKAYPELNNVKVEFYEGTKGSDFRGNATIDGTIAKVGETTMLFTRTDSLVGTDSKSTIGHEIAHALQSLEGFARGDNPNAFVKIASEMAGVLETDTEENAREKINNLDTSVLNKDEKKIITLVKEVIRTNKIKLLKDSYYLLQGEIDARAVELAMKLKQTVKTNIDFNYSNLISLLGEYENIDLVNQSINIFIDDLNLSKPFQKESVSQEPSATFNGFNTYAEAVKNTPINDIIKIDIEGVNVAEITNNGDINDLIRQDILADQRELSPNGSIVYVTKGNSLAKKLVNAEIAREIVKGRVNEQGNIVAREKVELTEVSEDFNKNKKEFGEEAAITILASQIVVNNTPAFGNNRIIDYSIEIPNDNVLMAKLINLLQE